MTRNGKQEKHAGCRILIAGTGGQGVLTAARLLCDCFVALGHDVVSSQLHGMAQRGGAVQSSVIVDGGVSPVMPKGRADCVLGFEPIETARAIPFMSPRTFVVMNIAPITPFVLAQKAISKQGGGDYPNVQALVESVRAVTAHIVTLDATTCAIVAGTAKAMNMVMLGCLFATGVMPCSAGEFRTTIVDRLPTKIREVNARAFDSGVSSLPIATARGATP